ncbi:MAG: HypC/HybG/HupF family hydrogenase formation chaperone, partial [Spirochaetota bacterium]
MCLAIPLELIKISSDRSTGTVRVHAGTFTVGLNLVPEARVGDFVLVHAGMAIELLETS